MVARPDNMTVPQTAAWNEADRRRVYLHRRGFILPLLIAAGCAYEWFIGERHLSLWVTIPLGVYCVFLAANELYRWRESRRVLRAVADGELTDRHEVAVRMRAAGRGLFNRFGATQIGAVALGAVTDEWDDAVDLFEDDNDDEEEIKQVVERYLDAFCAGDLDKLAAVLDDGFKLTGPMGRYDSAAAYLKDLEGQSTDGFAYTIDRLVINAEDEEASVVYTFTKPGAKTTIAQWFSIAGGRIVETQLVFDPAGM